MGCLEPVGLGPNTKIFNLVSTFVLASIFEMAKRSEPCTHLYLGEGIDLNPSPDIFSMEV
jgi:hypothetical protein